MDQGFARHERRNDECATVSPVTDAGDFFDEGDNCRGSLSVDRSGTRTGSQWPSYLPLAYRDVLICGVT